MWFLVKTEVNHAIRTAFYQLCLLESVSITLACTFIETKREVPPSWLVLIWIQKNYHFLNDKYHGGLFTSSLHSSRFISGQTTSLSYYTKWIHFFLYDIQVVNNLNFSITSGLLLHYSTCSLQLCDSNAIFKVCFFSALDVFCLCKP